MRWMQNMAASIAVPQVVNSLNPDPVMRDVQSMSDAIMARIPGFSEHVTPRYNIFGEPRSEEHTSELQSHSDLVCGLLLEKKQQRGSYWFGARQGRHGRHAGNRVRLAGPCA